MQYRKTLRYCDDVCMAESLYHLQQSQCEMVTRISLRGICGAGWDGVDGATQHIQDQTQGRWKYMEILKFEEPGRRDDNTAFAI